MEIWPKDKTTPVKDGDFAVAVGGNLPALSLSALFSLNSQVLLPWGLVLSVVGSLIWALIAAVQWED